MDTLSLALPTEPEVDKVASYAKYYTNQMNRWMKNTIEAKLQS